MHSGISRILAFPKNGNIYTEKLYEEVEKRGVGVTEGRWSSRWLMRNLRRGDLIHLHWPSFLYVEPTSQLRTNIRLAKMAGIMSLAKLRGASIIWTAHNLYPHEGGRNRFSHRLGRRITVAFADHVIVHGASAAALVAEEFNIPKSRLRIGHHPHWMDHYANVVTRAASRLKLGVGADEFLYLHIGRCKPYKGLEGLIEAFPAAPQPARLLIAGKFSSPQYLQEVAALAHRTPNVTLLPGSVPDDELQTYLNAADCVVLPYREILTSGTALLALSFGRPVIAPNLGSMRDHVDSRSGILYDATEPLGLAQALRDIQSRSFDPTATQTQARRFTWSAMADLLLEPERKAAAGVDLT